MDTVAGGAAEDQIQQIFLPYGPLSVDWPHKPKSTKLPLFPNKGYVFIIFEEEVLVHRLIRSCVRAHKTTPILSTGYG